MGKLALIAIVAGAVVLAGCSKKTLPPSAGALAPGVDASMPNDSSRLQADLAAAAGSDRVLFDLDSHLLTATARSILTGQAEWLRRHPGVTFTIEGHCDERGTRDYNLALGQRRANSAADYLIGLAIAPERIRTISYGKERPEALGSDADSYVRNRRAVSIVIDGRGG
jgi:peptidoglycan-associated lipoprotein